MVVGASRELAWFTVRAVGTLLGPFLVLTAFMAFAPSAFNYPVVVVCLCVAVGLVSCYPAKFSTKAVALRVGYIVVMLEALAWWTLFAVMHFPKAWPYLRIDL
jgi:hypothetical protein